MFIYMYYVVRILERRLTAESHCTHPHRRGLNTLEKLSTDSQVRYDGKHVTNLRVVITERTVDAS